MFVEIPTRLDMVPSLDTIERDVMAGLLGDADRLDESAENEDFYQLQNAGYIERREAEDEQEFQRRPKRTSKLLRCVIRKLSEPLYNPGPVRHWDGEAGIDSFLQQVYQDVSLNTRMQQADRAACLNHVAALQIEATGDVRRPLRVWLWKGHEFAVFCHDGDPCTPWAVCTLDQVPGPDQGTVRTRYRVWSAAERRTYLSHPWKSIKVQGERIRIGGRQVEIMVAAESGDSPYPGVLPFVFIRNEPVECDFWSSGLGTSLRECNRDLDRALSDLAQHVSTFLNPFQWARNISVSTRFFSRVGKFLHLKADPSTRAGDSKGEPEVGILQPSLAVEQAWYDLKTYADETLEELEVPLTLVRTDDPREMSGVAIQAKASPLVMRTRARQPAFTEYEVAFAATALAVAGIWYQQPALVVSASDPHLTVVWPEPRVLETNTAEGLQALQTEIDLGLTDPIEVLARVRGLTIEQAEELAETIAERRKRWNEIMAGLEAPATPDADLPGEVAEDEGGDVAEGREPDSGDKTEGTEGTE